MDRADLQDGALRDPGLRVDRGLPETPWRQVDAMLLMAAARTPVLFKDSAPFALQRPFARPAPPDGVLMPVRPARPDR